MTTKILTATDRTVKAMQAAAATLSANIAAAQTALPELLGQIEMAQSDLAAIQQETQDKVRRSKVDLSLQVEENKKKVLDNLLKEFGLANISMAELTKMSTELLTAKQENASEVSKAVGAAVATVRAEAAATIERQDAAHRVAVAEKDAALTAKDMQIQMLQDSVSRLEATIVAEREARVAEAEARSRAQGVVVNNTK